MTEQLPSAEALSIAEDIANNCMFEKAGARAIDTLIAQRVCAETERWQNRDRQRLEQIERLQATVGSFQSAQAERPAPETVHLTLREQSVMKRALLRSTRLMEGTRREGLPDDHPLQTGPSALASTGGRPPVSGDQVLQPYAGTIWRHHKRGTTYEMVGTAEVQATDPLAEGQRAVVYRSTHDGKLWVRPDEEFFDGRFDPITPFDLTSTGEQSASPAAVDYTERARELLRALHCWRLLYHDARPIDDPDVGQIAAVLSAVASAAAIRAFGKGVWSDTEEVAYQAGVSDTLAKLQEPDVREAVRVAIFTVGGWSSTNLHKDKHLADAALAKIAEMLK